MRISPVNNQINNYPTAFGINLQSPKLKFTNDDFFVHIKGYGKNYRWVEKIKQTADIAVNFIRENLDFESLLRYITAGVREANQFPTELDKRIHSGILRTERNNWMHGSDWTASGLITRYDGCSSKYKGYKDRLDNTSKHPLNNPYKNFMLTKPMSSIHYGTYLDHSNAKYVNRALDMISDLYRDLHKNYIEKEATEADLDTINRKIAEIRWILAHSTPWERGSDTISNTFIRSIYKAMGIKTSPLKRGVSLDLEAYCTNLEEYKNNFSSYFRKSPYIAE